MEESSRLQTLNSGITSEVAIESVIAEISENSDVLAGTFWSYGNAGLVNPTSSKRDYSHSWIRSGIALKYKNKKGELVMLKELRK